MLESGPEIDKLILAATKIAADKNHQYFTLEHCRIIFAPLKPSQVALV